MAENDQEVCSSAPPLASSSQRSLIPNEELGTDTTVEERGRGWRVPNLTFMDKVSLGYTSLASQTSFRTLEQARDLVSMQTPNAEHRSNSGGIRLRDGMNLPGVGEIRWKTMKKLAAQWLRNPKNLALLAWILAVAVSGAILFMVMTGMLNHEIPQKTARDAWFEVNNQILNALFTLMCLYLHPQRFLHLYQLYRWNKTDVIALRKVYCKDGLRKPHEWAHMLVVVILLHLNCFSQYALCGLNWGYKRSQRPAIGVAVCLSGAIGFSVAGGIYNVLSPLGRDYVEDEEGERLRKQEEGAVQSELEERARAASGKGRGRFRNLLERRRSFASRDGKVVEHPEWEGSVVSDCCMDKEVAVLTSVCSVCVFGWNMERLGFGNRFVHIATFLLICSAPYWIFLLAAGNLDNKYVKQGLGIAGIVLSIFGLMYGGFWRIKMRSTYGLPAQKWCCGQPNMTDCMLWMFCSLCSLCQEVRTAQRYDIRDEKFYVKERRSDNGVSEEGACLSDSSSPGPSPLGRERASTAPYVEMVAPSPVTVEREENGQRAV